MPTYAFLLAVLILIFLSVYGQVEYMAAHPELNNFSGIGLNAENITWG